MKFRIFGLVAIATFALAPDQSRAADLTTLVSFNGTDGAYPSAGLIADASGNLFGTTAGGGAPGWLGAEGGTVFEIAKTAGGYASTLTTLVSFCQLTNCFDGLEPRAGLIIDANGNLFGTTVYGGGALESGLEGTVFEIAKTASGYASIATRLVGFDCGSPTNCADGRLPYAGLIADANGNLFGTASGGGAYNGQSFPGPGTVFEIGKTGFTILVSFNGTDGENPMAGLVLDANGNLFGTTSGGGATGNGTVFEVVKTASGYASTPTTLVSFNGSNGAGPMAGLILDAAGNLFGTTSDGGATGNGTVFEIVNNGISTTPSYASTPITLASFDGADGAGPVAGLIADAVGNLFSTTASGGATGNGTVFEVVKTASGYASTPTTLVSIDGTNDGAMPLGGLMADANGNLFGTAYGGGAYNAGTVFEVTGSGFIPPGVLAGTPGQASCFGMSVASLAQKYGGFDAAAAFLGYSIQDLQNEVMIYCGGVAASASR